MGLLTDLRSPTELRSWLGSWPMSEFPRVFGAGPTATGIAVDEYSILNYAPVYACTAVISGDVGSLPLVLNRVSKDGSKERYEDHKLYELVHDRPNPEMSSMVWRETIQGHALTWGNGYAEIQRDGADRPSAVWPLTPDRVTPFRERDSRGRSGPLQYRVTNAGGGQTVLQARNMIHVPGMGFDGNVGYSIVNLARESFALGIATERFGGTFFGNGATFGGVLSHPSNLTPEVKQGIRESIDAVHGGVDRAHKFIIVGGGMKYEKLGIPPNDAQFLETRRFQIAEVARWFGGIPLHKLGDLERATFSNIEQQDIEYYKSCLRRWLIRWEQELNYKLISPLERRSQRIEFVVEGLLRGDSQARAEFYSKMFNIGAYSINMILEKENMNTIGPEGDVHYVPANMLAADVAMKGPLPTVTEVKPKELPPVDDEDDEDEDDEDERALKTLLSEIAGNTAALGASMAAERDAMSQAERGQHQQVVTRLEEERGRLQQVCDEYRAHHAADTERLDQARQTAEAIAADEQQKRIAAETAAAAAQAVQGDMDRQRTEATEARTVAEAARAEAERQRTEAAAELIAQHQAETARLTGMLTAHRALIVDAMGRMVRRETEKARRHQATADKLRTWAESFYVTESDLWVEALRPALRAHLTWKQSTEDVDAVTLGLVRDHIAESHRQLRAIVDGDPEDMHANLERMLTRWEQERPNALADRILREEVEYVRTLH